MSILTLKQATFLGCATGVVLVLAALPNLSIAADVLGESSNEAVSLQEVLEAESRGEGTDRQNLVKLDTGNQDPQTAWQAGWLKVEDDWIPAKDLNPQSLDLEAYLAARERLQRRNSPDLAIARWCRKNGFESQARAHYSVALQSNPNLVEAREFLGHVSVAGGWVERDTFQQAMQRRMDRLEAIRQWSPRLLEIVQATKRGDRTAHVAALRSLDAIDDPRAIPALEAAARLVEADLATLMVKKIAKWRSEDACLALLRIAIHQDVSEARSIAIREIKTYPEQLYVPQLLGLLPAKTQVTSRLVIRPNGMLALDLLVGAELQDRRLLRREQSVMQVLSLLNSRASASSEDQFSVDRVRFGSNELDVGSEELGPGSAIARYSANSSASSNVGARDLIVATAGNMREAAASRTRASRQSNRLKSDLANRVCGVLRELTGVELNNDAKAWWDWYATQYSRETAEKPIALSLGRQRYSFSVRSDYESNNSSSSQSQIGETNVQVTLSRYVPECLVAGTPIQTATGLVPIEQIQVGDLVLAQDIETGQLDLKPILQTTVRRPTPTLRIVTESEVIETIAGHVWWVSGEGWKRTNELQPGMQLRTTSGTTEVLQLEENSVPQVTYNLIVADYNNYFVGQSRVLSYDFTTVRPTLKTVPGFSVATE